MGSSATWNLGTNSAFALGPRKTTENLDQVGRSQNVLDANRLLGSSPALNPRALTLVPTVLLCFYFLFLTSCFLQLLLIIIIIIIIKTHTNIHISVSVIL
jgi:hypothetical protein